MSNNKYVCDCHAINTEAVDKVKKKMPSDNEMNSLATFYKMLGDGTRCKIIFALFGGEMCVCDISYLLSMTKSAVSHQLSKMKESGIVKCRREGKEIYYSLDDSHVASVFELSLIHIRHREGKYEK